MKIKSCPFCGGEVVIKFLKKDRLDTLDSMGKPPMFHRCKDGWRIECINLKCEIKPHTFLSLGNKTDAFAKELIINKWNKRANPA